MHIKIQSKIFSTISIFLLSLSGLPAHAALLNIDFTAPSTRALFGTVVGQGIEVGLNANFFNPAGIEMDTAAAYVAISSGIHGDVSVSDPGGLLVISNSGFILRFNNNVTAVQVTFNDFFDDGLRNLYAYDTLVNYTRDVADINWSPKGSVTANPSSSTAIISDSGIIPTGNSGNTLTLSVSGTNIRSVWVNTPPLFSGVSSISINTVPVPAAIWLFGSGLIGLIGIARRKKI